MLEEEKQIKTLEEATQERKLAGNVRPGNASVAENREIETKAIEIRDAEVQTVQTNQTVQTVQNVKTEQTISADALAENAKRAVQREKQKPSKNQKKLLKLKRKAMDWTTFTAYLLPSLSGVVIFFFMPLFMLGKISFQKSATKTDFIGFINYERVITNNAFQSAAKNTLTFAALAVPLAVVLALLIALLLNSGMPGKSFFRSILLNPMMVPVASIVLIWQVFFSYNGVINGWSAQLFGLDKIDWLKSDYAQIVILIMFLWKNLGYNMVLFLAALNNIPEEIIESAKMDGAGPLKRFFSIKMYYLSSTLFFVGIMSLINSFKIFREVYLLTGDYPYDNLYMLQHFMNNAFTHLDYSKLSAGAIIMCIAMIIIVGVLFICEAKFGENIEE